ncbi:addiction module HigA family antidote [Prauserella isguenensis]|uniref:Addiction module HigA family antidote n=1 Tax=Prauserella isguenensis TaxID=1470180 RepID=A0A839SA57_9PSEU|nr:HigA family addiction module antitoxin [Prauserella isguenensis]MBB3053549.1 addiction module HigA family antidote [Prauserella isguenensis]
MTSTPTMPPVHPGEILKEEFLDPMGITPYRLAKEIGVDQTRLSQIIAGTRSITADTGLRLSRFFNMSEGFWTGLQELYDRETARDELGDKLERIHPISA